MLIIPQLKKFFFQVGKTMLIFIWLWVLLGRIAFDSKYIKFGKIKKKPAASTTKNRSSDNILVLPSLLPLLSSASLCLWPHCLLQHKASQQLLAAATYIIHTDCTSKEDSSVFPDSSKKKASVWII